MVTLLLPFWVIRVSIGAVWLYEGLWCKLLRSEQRESQVVAAVPYFGPRIGVLFLKTLGLLEVALTVWVLSGSLAGWCAVVQTLLLITLNGCGLLWARRVIPDPGGMVIKNFAFLVLVWVLASQSGWV